MFSATIRATMSTSPPGGYPVSIVTVRFGYCAAAGSAIASRKKRINLKVGLELRRECGYHRPVEEGKENKRRGNGEPKERTGPRASPRPCLRCFCGGGSCSIEA